MEETTISLRKDYEVRHWMRVLRCTEAQLYAAVAAVGTDVETVQKYLSENHSRASMWQAFEAFHKRP